MNEGKRTGGRGCGLLWGVPFAVGLASLLVAGCADEPPKRGRINSADGIANKHQFV